MADTEQLAQDEDKRCTLFDKPKRFCQRCSEFHAADEWGETCERYLGGAPIRRCKTCGGDHPLDRWPGNCMPERNWNESDLPVCRNFISDNLEAQAGLNGLVSMADGQRYTSKSELRKGYRRAGVEEVGNDSSLRTHVSERQAAPEKTDKQIEADIKEAIDQAHAELTDGTLTDDAMKTWLRPENAPTATGFSVGG